MNANTPQSECAAVREQLALLLYGELSFDEEERVEVHLETCAECRVALDRQRELLAAIDQVAVEPSPALLMQCREALEARLAVEPREGLAAAVTQRQDGASWLERALDLVAPRFPSTWMRPAGAFALIAMGFLGARMAPNFGGGMFGDEASLVGNPGAARVSYFQPTADGKIQIVLDETRQRTVVGRMDDENIRTLLLAATRDPDPGLREQTVSLLTGRAKAADVRNALVYAVRNDQNAGVRLSAIEGLRPFVGEPEVRGALTQVLENDTNAGMRTKAIDMLIEGMSGSGGSAGMDRQMIQVFQELMSREDNNTYVRQKCQRALELVKASAEIY